MYRFRYTNTEYEDVKTEQELKRLMYRSDWFVITIIDDLMGESATHNHGSRSVRENE